jgi:hypothetical protein
VVVGTTLHTWTWAWQWWGALVAINAVNLVIAIVLFARAVGATHDADGRYRRFMAVLGLVFICVALYRAVFPSSYLDQLAWFDTVLNSSLVIRCMAILAELSFAGLIAKSLLRMNADVPELVNGRGGLASWFQTKAPIFLFGCILIANVCATTATITKVHVLFAIEETLWCLGFLSIIPMLLMSLRRLFAHRRTAAGARQGSFPPVTNAVQESAVREVIGRLGGC